MVRKDVCPIWSAATIATWSTHESYTGLATSLEFGSSHQIHWDIYQCHLCVQQIPQLVCHREMRTETGNMIDFVLQFHHNFVTPTLECFIGKTLQCLRFRFTIYQAIKPFSLQPLPLEWKAAHWCRPSVGHASHGKSPGAIGIWCIPSPATTCGSMIFLFPR